jgi:hypothetical protein
MSASPAIDIAHYRGGIPAFVEPEMERLYGSPYSALFYFRIYGGAENADTYVSRRDGEVAAVFLFRIEGRMVRVLNEGMQAPVEEVECFVDFAFAAFPDATGVVFNAVPEEFRHSRRPHQRAMCSDDIAVSLDATVQEYLARLGPATRKNLRRHRNRLERDHPSFRFEAHAGDSVDECVVRDIIAMNRMRMAVKGKVSALDEDETQRILGLVRERGMITTATVNGNIAAGAIVLRIGDTFCSLVNAHDARYDSYRLGTICCYLTIAEAIERGGRRFDLMWGHYEYKTALLGEHRYLYRVVVYRSRLHQLARLPLAASVAANGLLCSFRMRMLELANQEAKVDSPLLARALHAVRRIRMAAAVRQRATQESLPVREHAPVDMA